jgi:hypothetical protein
MSLAFQRLACAAAALAALAAPALAESLAVSSAAGGSSASSASSATSDSLGDSSASSKRNAAAAAGPYRVVALAPVPDRPDALSVTLQALGDEAADPVLRLVIPKRAIERGGVQAGQTIVAAPRPYGVAFARAGAAEPFFLVVADEVHRELRANPVSL